MMPGKSLDSTSGACSFWPPFMVAGYLILFLVAFAIIPARADMISAQFSVHGVSVSEYVPGIDKSSPDSDATSHSSFPSESISPSAPDISNGQYSLPEQAVPSHQDFHLDEGMHLRSGLGTIAHRGTASWYGPGFHGRKSADGERFNMYSMTAAHPSLPLLSWILVRNIRNNKVALLKVTDRGPYRGKRILDVSYAAAKQLGFIHSGTAQVEVRQLSQSEVSWVRRQLDERSEMSTAEDTSSSLDTPYEAAVKVPQIIRRDDK
jgi:rare lipoprotein A